MKETKFKQTEVGMIPWDWEVKCVDDCGTLKSGESPSNFTFVTSGIPYFKVDQMNNCNKYQIETPYFIAEKVFVPEGSILFPKRGAAIETNKVRILKQNSFFDTNVMSLTLDSSSICNEFFYYWLLKKELWKIADTTSVPQINNKHIKPLLFPCPNFEEQQRIANALSDVDTLIINLEKLIAKKKNIKQGAMQQLLTGRKRLPGFGPSCHPERSTKCAVEGSSHFKMTELGPIPSDWDVVPLNELGHFLGGGTPSTKNQSFWNGSIPWLSSADLHDDEISQISVSRFITQDAVNCSATQICPQGTILIIARVGVGKLALTDQAVCTSQDFCNLVPFKENDSLFLTYSLLPVMKRMANESQGTSIKGVAVNEIKKLNLVLPSSKAEQTAIANVLSDMDSEIQTLETKLAKYRKLKTGMMQQLLTGKIRLV